MAVDETFSVSGLLLGSGAVICACNELKERIAISTEKMEYVFYHRYFYTSYVENRS
jgi:hypothetical protein